MRTLYASIKDIIPVTKNWKVKMLVAEKSPKRIARNSITKYQNLTLIDPQGNRLQAVIFGKDIDLRDDTLQVFQSYYIGNAYVKAIDPRHKIESHEYQWIINSRTIIENVEDDEPVLKAPEYNIIPFNELDAYKDTDSEIAIAIQMMPPREVSTVNGKATVQDIQLIDKSLKPLILTMWARFVHDECQQISNIIATKPIILGMRIKVGSYEGLSLSSQVTSVFTIDPLLPAAVSLRTCSRVYLEIEDDTGYIAVVAFGLVAEEILNFTAVYLLEHTGEERLPYLANIASAILEKEWIIHLRAEMNQYGQLRQNKLNVLYVESIN
ncbi:replication protein A 70 kDa DNA-binding subunit B-like [Carya illinoinensis]|uniref:replication protein A 70 kDa DNA-binding subunit B-like n=1 Tax=Carya illinoinensis TaxID=32201 RepID=UPI001C72925B|nr:replication protein A 70 kDa DNA-binding subunit B-like [Carya illinoinensis]